jgi:hypothetical protein
VEVCSLGSSGVWFWGWGWREVGGVGGWGGGWGVGFDRTTFRSLSSSWIRRKFFSNSSRLEPEMFSGESIGVIVQKKFEFKIGVRLWPQISFF